MRINPPPPEEYAPFYTEYVRRASARGDVIAALLLQLDEIRLALGPLTDSQALTRISAADWSVKEVVSHLIDVERVFSYRFLRITRKDKTPLPGFEQEDYVRESRADELPLPSLLNEFESVRHATIHLIRHTKDSAFVEIGTASGAPVSARALVYMIVGHVDHHMASLREEYLPIIK